MEAAMASPDTKGNRSGYWSAAWQEQNLQRIRGGQENLVHPVHAVQDAGGVLGIRSCGGRMLLVGEKWSAVHPTDCHCEEGVLIPPLYGGCPTWQSSLHLNVI